MKEKGLRRSKEQNPHLTLILLPYNKAVVTTIKNHTTYIQLIIREIPKNGHVVSKTAKKTRK